MISERFETPGDVALDIRNGDGEVELEAVDARVTEVEVDARGAEDDVRELLAGTRVEHRRRGDRDEVRVQVPKRGGLFRRSLDVRVVVRAPEGAAVRVKAASADTHARGRFGSVAVDSASGDVELGAVSDADVNVASGDVEIEAVDAVAAIDSASGDVTIGRVGGALTVNSASGNVVVHEAAKDVAVSTASGGQRVGAVSEGRVRLRAASGDIEVGIAKGSNVWIDARSLSGETTSELELGDAEPTEEAGPLVELQAMSMSGDVRIVRAPAPSVPA